MTVGERCIYVRPEATTRGAWDIESWEPEECRLRGLYRTRLYRLRSQFLPFPSSLFVP